MKTEITKEANVVTITDLGVQVSEDGRTFWRKNGEIIERRSKFSSDWRPVADTTDCPKTPRELEIMCLKWGCGYIPPISFYI